jgi:spore photoproduct lyase
MKFPIEQIWVDHDALEEPLTREILEKLPTVEVFSGQSCVEQLQHLALDAAPILRGKRVLRLLKNRGAFVKPCPGTPQYLCCGLEILHIGQGCPMDCRYCALQAYFNRPVLELFVNIDDLMEALRQHLEREPGKFHRICTGEFTDSLALDHLTGLSRRLVEFFANRKNASLEIKTKTDFVEPLLKMDPGGRVIVSFSVNSGQVTALEERRAAKLEARLAAAVRAQRAGYRIAFHFDPIIPLSGWEEDYSATIDKIFEAIEPTAIAWISLGVLRFVPELKDAAWHRFGPIPYFHEGFVRGLDGKSRLHADRRIRVYRVLAEHIRAHALNVLIYLCMESPHVWERSLGVQIASSSELTALLDGAISAG